MIVSQIVLTNENWKNELIDYDFSPNFFLLFVSSYFKDKEKVLEHLRKAHPEASVIGCSTAGEIADISVFDATLTITAIKFEKVEFRKIATDVSGMAESFNAGKNVGEQLKREDLKHILVFSDGLNINGADLVDGMKSILPNVTITGGLAGDSSRFHRTFVINDDTISDRMLVAVGFYGDDLKIETGTGGGWDSFGIERLVTRSDKNILYELDSMPALELYKSYLKEKAAQLPGSGLLFPLSMRFNANSEVIVRTILGIDEKEQSLIFAGNIPEGSYVRLMKANVDRLIQGAEESAVNANKFNTESELAILISCVGRRVVLKQLVEEEIEAVRDVLGKKPVLTGFYSYGEIAPNGEFSPCELHNQTMTITTLSEN